MIELSVDDLGGKGFLGGFDVLGKNFFLFGMLGKLFLLFGGKLLDQYANTCDRSGNGNNDSNDLQDLGEFRFTHVDLPSFQKMRING